MSLRFSSFRHTLQSRSHFSQDSLIYHPPPLETYFPTLNVPPSPNSVPLHPLSARSFPPPLTILTLFPPPLDRRPPPSFSFPCVPFIIRRPCPTPTHPGVCFESTTCTTPRRFRRARGLHFPPALLFSSLTDSSASPFSCYLVHVEACSREPDEIVASSPPALLLPLLPRYPRNSITSPFVPPPRKLISKCVHIFFLFVYYLFQVSCTARLISSPRMLFSSVKKREKALLDSPIARYPILMSRCSLFQR